MRRPVSQVGITRSLLLGPILLALMLASGCHPDWTDASCGGGYAPGLIPYNFTKWKSADPKDRYEGIPGMLSITGEHGWRTKAEKNGTVSASGEWLPICEYKCAGFNDQVDAYAQSAQALIASGTVTDPAELSEIQSRIKQYADMKTQALKDCRTTAFQAIKSTNGDAIRESLNIADAACTCGNLDLGMNDHTLGDPGQRFEAMNLQQLSYDEGMAPKQAATLAGGERTPDTAFGNLFSQSGAQLRASISGELGTETIRTRDGRNSEQGKTQAGSAQGSSAAGGSGYGSGSSSGAGFAGLNSNLTQGSAGGGGGAGPESALGLTSAIYSAAGGAGGGAHGLSARGSRGTHSGSVTVEGAGGTQVLDLGASAEAGRAPASAASEQRADLNPDGSPTRASLDPADYFTRINLDESLFKKVEKRYAEKALQWRAPRAVRP